MMDLKMEVYTPDLELIGFLEIQRSVIWTEKAFSSGSFSMESLITDETRALLVPENIIWIEGETAGIIEYVHEEAGESGPYIVVKGCTLTGILARRILWGRYDLKGAVPQIMCRLVDDCCIHPTRGDVEARKIPGLVLIDPPSGGEEIRIQKTGGELLEALEELGETYGVAFGVRFNPAIPQMEFWTRWGQNRSIHQTVNEPVFYSTELDDVLSSEYCYSAQDYRNVALVAGEGEGDDRTMVVVEASIPEPPTPPAPTTKYTITLAVDPAGSGATTGGGQIAEGQSVTVTATPATDFEFTAWKENGQIVSTNAAYTFTVTADRTLTAVFTAIIPTYTITATIDPAGSGTVTGTGQYQEGESVTVKAVAADGYKFAKWTVNGQEAGTGESYTFTVTEDVEIVAVFEEKPASRLPVGYTEVKYVKTGRRSWVDLSSIKKVSGKRFLLDATTYYTDPLSYVDPFILSGSKSRGFFYLGFTPRTNKFCYNFGEYNSSGADYVSADIFEKRKIIDLNFEALTISFGSEDKFDIYDSTDVNTLFLGGKQSCILMDIYSFAIYSSGETIIDFVPCVNDSGVAGFYDLAQNTFVTSGGDKFTAGPAV